jgi:hypothetical protein
VALTAVAMGATGAAVTAASEPTGRLTARTAADAAGASEPTPPRPPHLLPGDATVSSLRADPRTWVVGARPGATAGRVAARFGAHRFGPGGYEVARTRSRALAGALRRAGVLLYSEPNRLARTRQGPLPDPLSATPYDWRSRIVGAATAPPAVTAQSPLLALIDSQLEASHPEFVGGNVATLPTSPALAPHFHGTATASVAAAPANGAGILGVWPGMRALNVPLPVDGISCADSAGGVNRALASGAAVINMSYGSTSPCYAEYVQLQRGIRAGAIPVAAAGNEFAQGNPLEFPASLPHVLTVAATATDDKAAFFSNANAAIDLSAPGVDVEAAITGNTWGALAGTSFSAPMVSAATAWVRAARPELTPEQVAQVVRLSAVNVGAAGWDPVTGYGLLNIDRALSLAPPPADPREPNDDIAWVSGRAFGTASPAIWSGGGPRRFTALIDAFEDPADVYRVRIPGRARVRVSVTPQSGATDVAAHKASARAIDETRTRLARSARRGRRTDSVNLRNRSRRARTVYVSVSVDQHKGNLNGIYSLVVRRR